MPDDMPNVVTLGLGPLLSMVFRRASMLGIRANHVSPFLEAHVSDYRSAFRRPLSRQTAYAMASDIRLDMRGVGRVFSPKSSLAFDPLHSVSGFSYSMSPRECVDMCAAAFRSHVDDAFDLIESDESAMFIMLAPRGVRRQEVYSTVSGILAANPRAKRRLYLMSPTEFHAGVSKQSHGFYTMPFPPACHDEQGIVMAVPYVQHAISHFAS